MSTVMNNLNYEIRQLNGRTLEGLIDAVIILQRAADKSIPLDTGNLRASWFVVTSGSDNGDMVIGKFKGPNASEMTQDFSSVTTQAKQVAKANGREWRPLVLFGYTANYAVFVHEKVDAKFKRPTAKARWLYSALKNNRKEMIEAIRKKAKFK